VRDTGSRPLHAGVAGWTEDHRRRPGRLLARAGCRSLRTLVAEAGRSRRPGRGVDWGWRRRCLLASAGQRTWAPADGAGRPARSRRRRRKICWLRGG